MEHPWEEIYRNDGWPQQEPVPLFYEIVSNLRQKGCRRILDLGCGNGNYIVPFAREGFDVVGTDISFTGLWISKQRLADKSLPTKLVQSDFRNPLPFKDESFEGVWSLQVIHHARIAEIRLGIEEIWRILSRGGYISISVSGQLDDDYQYEEIEAGTFAPLDGPEKGLPHHIFTEEEVRDEFERFEIEEVFSRLNGKVIIILARK